MIQIQNLSLADKTLTLDYRVSNPFEEAIWVCYDTWVHGEQDVQNTSTTIDGETVRIKLHFSTERDPGFSDPPAIAKYVRLRPGESHSGRIVRNLPTKDYVHEWRAERKEHEEIVLHRAVFEVGYFAPKRNDLLDSLSEKFKEESTKPKPKVLGPYHIYFLPDSPLITEETLDGQLREVMYTKRTSLVQKEESAQVLITDVNISCSVVVDDE